MTEKNYDRVSYNEQARSTENRPYHPIYMWTRGVPVEDQAMSQLKNVSGLPFIFKHVAAMPDVHWGMGATVGSVIATKGAIVPAAVGVDIGCGMMACKLNLKASDLPDNLHALRTEIERVVPHGRTDNGGPNDRGAWCTLPQNTVWGGIFADRYKAILAKHPKIEMKKHPLHHLGTLGTGNHFIEICLDEEQSVWIMLHSGSRGIGNRIGTYFIDKAKEEMRRYHIDKFLPDQDLSYLVEHTEIYDDYIEALDWAQDFARINRQQMMLAVIKVMTEMIGPKLNAMLTAINCHHNYVEKENHFGENVLVTRKGAVRARKDDLGIIPGSMGARSFIVRGKGNPDSFCSCSHGAGRKLSRTQAKKDFTLEDHIKATEGVECRKDLDVLDETPGAYKDVEAVMAAQSDLVEIVHVLKQCLCVKG